MSLTAETYSNWNIPEETEQAIKEWCVTNKVDEFVEANNREPNDNEYEGILSGMNFENILIENKPSLYADYYVKIYGVEPPQPAVYVTVYVDGVSTQYEVSPNDEDVNLWDSNNNHYTKASQLTNGANYLSTSPVPVSEVVTYYDKNGNTSQNPIEFDLVGGMGGPFTMPHINWANGDYIEIKIMGSNSTPFILGNLYSVSGNYNYQNCIDIFVWPGNRAVKVHNEIGADIAITTNLPNTIWKIPVIIRIEEGTLKYKSEEEENFTVITSNDFMFQDYSKLGPYDPSKQSDWKGDGELHWATQNQANIDTHYYYFKLVQKIS